MPGFGFALFCLSPLCSFFSSSFSLSFFFFFLFHLPCNFVSAHVHHSRLPDPKIAITALFNTIQYNTIRYLLPSFKLWSRLRPTHPTHTHGLISLPVVGASWVNGLLAVRLSLHQSHPVTASIRPSSAPSPSPFRQDTTSHPPSCSSKSPTAHAPTTLLLFVIAR